MATPERAIEKKEQELKPLKPEWQLRQSNMDSELFLPVLWVLTNAIGNMENCADVIHVLWNEYLESEDAEELTKAFREFAERVDEFAVFFGKSCKLLSSAATGNSELSRSALALEGARKRIVACLDKH